MTFSSDGTTRSTVNKVGAIGGLNGSFPLDTQDEVNKNKGQTRGERETRNGEGRGSKMKPLGAATGKFFEVEPRTDIVTC